jgi:hypothetical protein
VACDHGRAPTAIVVCGGFWRRFDGGLSLAAFGRPTPPAAMIWGVPEEIGSRDGMTTNQLTT